MTNKKLIRYAIASEKIKAVAQNERWGHGSGMLYQSELADDMRHYAKSRSGYDEYKGCAMGCLASLIGAISGATAGALLIGNGDETGLLARTLYKIGGGIGGFVSGGILTFLPTIVKSCYDDKVIQNVVKERRKRREKRGITGVTEAERRSANLGLVASEWDRADMMTGIKVPKPAFIEKQERK